MAVWDVLTFIFVILYLIDLTNAEARADLVLKQCRRKNHAGNVKQYNDNWMKMSELMRPEMSRNKYSFKEEGEPPIRMFVLAQCMNDLSSEECETCFKQIGFDLPGCFPSTGGRIYFDGCFIRFENYTFFGESLTPQEDTKICSHSVNNKEEYKEAATNVINKLITTAVDNQGYALENQKLHNASVYGMANCWKTLDRDSCFTCLENAGLAAISCLPSTEGRVLNAGCFLRYSDYEFASSSKKHNQVSFYFLYAIGAAAVCASAIGIGCFVAIIIYGRRQKHQEELHGMEVDLSLHKRGLQFLQFKYSTLEKATENFNEVHKLGQGGYGEVFRGTLPGGREIAIKRLYISGKCRTEEIYNEMDVISTAQHTNLVRFLGCCFTEIESFLVYEYLLNRSLDLILFDQEKKKELDWKKRLGIIFGTAEGLEYLHKDCQVTIIHRDIKASNILLDLRHKPKIADFGLARFYSCDKALINTAIAGTLGYMAPEYLAQGRLTEKVDVYSFGVLVLEIVSGVENNKFQSEETLATLVTTAWKHLQSNTVSQIIDESLDIEDNEEIKRVVQVGLLCTQEEPSLRPTMTMVIQMLRDKKAELPNPSKPPFMDMEVSYSSLGSSRHPSNMSDLRTSQNDDYDIR